MSDGDASFMQEILSVLEQTDNPDSSIAAKHVISKIV